ncbi:MAG: TIGR02444 family protein [Geminicoccaceae bacterium]
MKVSEASCAMDWPESSFWNYSLSLYGRPGVEHSCLELQRRHGLDVNLLLFVFWSSDRGIEVHQAILARAEQAVSTWHVEVIRPLRALRRRLAAQRAKADPQSLLGQWPNHVAKLQKDVLAIELDGEHLAQLALTEIGEGLQPTREPGVDLAGFNLARFCPFCSHDLDDLRIMLKQAFPATTETEMTGALSSFQA